MSGTPDDGPYLTWELRSEPIPGSFTKDHWWFQEAVVMHAPDGTWLWERRLPDRCRGWQVGIGDAEAKEHRERGRNTHSLYFLIGQSWTEDAVAFADVTGVLVLSRRDGEVLLDAPFPQPQDGHDWLWFDAGTFTMGTCEGNARGGYIFERCGTEWLYFNGRTLAAIDIATRRVTETAAYSQEAHETKASALDHRASIPLGKRTVHIRGTTFMR